MKNYKTIFKNCLLVLSIGLMFFITSCKNELDINAEYEDINIIYGVLDPSNQRQYIRINRAFLTEENALIAATEPDSSNYPYMLNVSVQEFNKNNQLIRTYQLDTVHLPKTDGVFNIGMQPFYYFDSPGIFSVSQFNDLSFDTLFFDPENKFKLRIENPLNGNVSESETMLIPNFAVTKPANYSKLISFISNNRTAVEMKSPEFAKVFEAKFIFYFREVYNEAPNDTIEKNIIWNLGTVKSDRISGGEDIYFQYVPSSFFSILKQRLPVLSNIKRFHGIFNQHGRLDVQLVITAGALELSTYIDTNKPSGSIIQDRPVYTNISNGIGLFSSKRTFKLNFYLNAFSVDSLRNGSTSNLNFQ